MLSNRERQVLASYASGDELQRVASKTGRGGGAGRGLRRSADDPAVEWTFEAEAGDCATDDEKDKSEKTSKSNESTPAPASGEELAKTGSSGIGTTVGLAALLLMVGTTLVLWARPRVLRGRNRA